VAFRSTCGPCDGQNINAVGDRTSGAETYEEALGETQPALVVDAGIDSLTADDPALGLFGADGIETTTTTSADGSTTTTSTTLAKEAESTTTSQGATTVVQTTKVTTEDASNTTVVQSTTTTAAPTTSTAPPPPATVNSNVPVSGSKIYVNPNGGSDSNNGSSESTALKTFRSAASRVQAGQTIYLMSGDYWEPAPAGGVHYNLWNKHGRSDAWIRVTAAPGHRPVLYANKGIGLLITGDYVEVSGLTIKGSGFSASNAQGVGINVGDAHHVRLIGNTVSGFPQSGLSIVRSSNIHVINNVVYDNAFWSSANGSGISFWNSANHGQSAGAGGYHDLIVGNRVYRNENKVNSRVHTHVKTDGNGIIIDESVDTGYTGKTLIANNLIYDNGGRGILAYKSRNIDIMFNTTYHNGRTRDLIGGPIEIATGRSANIRFYYNIGWARPGVPAFAMSSEMSGNVESKGNIWVTDSPHGDENRGTNNTLLNYNPGLRNPTTGSGADFRPNYGTMLQGYAGSGHGAVPNDLVGTSRGGSAEPGAFEAEAGSGR
jgi:parallel beta-helix repeat protein